MKVAFPSQEDRGLDSTVYGHFGSASYFVIVETDDGTFNIVQNPDRDHLHGHCQARMVAAFKSYLTVDLN